MTTAHDQLVALERWLNGPRFSGLRRRHGAREVLQRRGAFQNDYSAACVAAEQTHAQLSALAAVRSAVSRCGRFGVATAERTADVGSLVRHFVQSGIGVIEIHDRKRGVRGGASGLRGRLVSTETWLAQLSAARLQLDVMGVPGVAVAYTHAATTRWLETRDDTRDEPFVLGATELDSPPWRLVALALLERCTQALARALPEGRLRATGAIGSGEAEASRASARAEAQIATALAWLSANGLDRMIEDTVANAHDPSAHDDLVESAFDRLRKVWQERAVALTFGEAVARSMRWPLAEGRELAVSPARWRELARRAPLEELRERADALGIWPAWECERADSPEDGSQVWSGVEYAIARALAAAPHADLICFESATLDVQAARHFAESVRREYPGKLLGYALSPTHDGARKQASEIEQRTAFATLAALGFTLITHVNGGPDELPTLPLALSQALAGRGEA